MTVSLLIPFVLAPAGLAPAEPLTDPPVQLWLSSDAEYTRGDRARVYVRAEYDGYLVVLHADPDGRVRVLFPVDPVDDDFVRGGETLEIRSRGDREAFTVDERSGSGWVLAAWSADPFWFDGFVRGNHWDYRAIALDGVRGDPEAGLLDVVDRMAAGRGFEYDAVPYIIGRRASDGPRVFVSVGLGRTWCYGCVSLGTYGWRPGLHVGVTFGSPYLFGSLFYDPYYHPVWYRPVFYDPYWYRPVVYVPWYRPVYYDPFWGRFRTRDPYYYGGPRYRTGIGVGIHYAAEDCWDCDRRARTQRRAGIGTGVGFGEAYWRTAREMGTPSRPAGGVGVRQAVTRLASEPALAPRQISEGPGRSSAETRRIAQPAVDRASARATGVSQGVERSSENRSRIADPAARPGPGDARTMGLGQAPGRSAQTPTRAAVPSTAAGASRAEARTMGLGQGVDRSAQARSRRTQPVGGRSDAPPVESGQTRVKIIERGNGPASTVRVFPQAERGSARVRDQVIDGSGRATTSRPTGTSQPGRSAVRRSGGIGSTDRSGSPPVITGQPRRPDRERGSTPPVLRGSGSADRTGASARPVPQARSSDRNRAAVQRNPGESRATPRASQPSRATPQNRAAPSMRSSQPTRSAPAARSSGSARAAPTLRSSSNRRSPTATRSPARSRSAPAAREPARSTRSSPPIRSGGSARASSGSVRASSGSARVSSGSARASSGSARASSGSARASSGSARASSGSGKASSRSGRARKRGG